MRERLNSLYPLSSLLIGLTLAQILATVHVYSSNTVLYDSLLAIKGAGYLTIPNSLVIGQLRKAAPAFLGGLFFTFSIGAGISFLSLALAWIWDRLFYRKIFLLYVFLLLWVACLAAFNFHGFKLFVTLYFLLIAPVVFITAAKQMSYLNKKNQRSRPNEILHILPVIVLALLLAWQIDSRMFSDFRDIYLLSNPVGSKINKFYYKYTLYPAEVFKSLNQKMLKTAMIESQKTDVTRMLENIILNDDYIPIQRNIDADLKVISIGDDFIFKSHDRPVLRISAVEFFKDPYKAITGFEQKSDTWAFFRKITMFSLLSGFPLAVYVIVHGIISILFGIFFNLRTSSLIATILCFVLCLVFIFSFQLNRTRNISERNIADVLGSGRWQDRVAALKFIDKNGLEIKQFHTYQELLKSDYITERYWFVRTLANSRKPGTYRDLLGFLNDTHPNVASMALYGLGRRGNKEAIGKIMQVIKTSDDWYLQWYAYRALRALGWRQTKLN
jgi:Ca2+/Na+ antiporter